MSRHNESASRPGSEHSWKRTKNTYENDSNPTLEDLLGMFMHKIDNDVIEMIWQESHENGTAALEMLNVMSPPAPADSPISPATNSWSGLVTSNTKPFTEPVVKGKQIKESTEKVSISASIKERVLQHEKILVLMRGVPGCGKSHLANQMKGRGSVLSTDDFFMNHRGQYVFNPTLLSEAHDWNKKRTERELKARVNPIIIDNTNLEAWEMQPYISMALRYKYAVELVVPETSWNSNARILAQKNTHGVPLPKIHQMLDKLKIPLQFQALVDDCRQKTFGNNQRKIQSVAKADSEPKAEQIEKCPADPVLTNNSNTIKWEISPWDEVSPSLQVQQTTTAECLSTRDIGVQTSSSEASVAILTAQNRSINFSVTHKLPKKRSAKLTFDKGCNTEEIVEDLAARKATSILKSYFPMMEVKDLADFLDKCNGDLSWTVNLLLDSGYECAVDGDIALDDDDSDWETESRSESQASEGQPSTSSELSSNAASTGLTEESEALRKHVEDCFRLTDTLSDQTRRICGKEYHQFRAAQLQRLRHPPDLVYPPSMENSLYETADDTLVDTAPLSPQDDGRGSPTEAMIPMKLDPSFVQQLISLFGAPSLSLNSKNNATAVTPVSFDVPWSLAEQIYLHWCSNLITEEDYEDSQAANEDADLRNIMDIELAMQLVQEEKNAERKELRESLATKLSFQMLRDNYPLVDQLALDALFEANNYNYSHTITALNASLGTKPKLAQLPAAARPSVSQTDAQVPTTLAIRENKLESCDLRSEANMYNRMRQEYLTKAQENHRRGMYAVATYYASESRRYGDLYSDTHQKAALQIVGEKNVRKDEKTIDLHELRVIEALSYLESFIAENIQEGNTVIQVITGKGNHSLNGKPRIKPAVITFIKKKKYGFEEINAGMLRIFLRRARSV